MLPNPLTRFGHEVNETDDISIGISDDGERYVVRHDPSGETVELGPDGVETGALQSRELLVGQSNTVTSGPIGTTDEFIPIWNGRFNVDEFTTTSTTYTRVSGNGGEIVVPYSDFSLTNIDSYHVSWSGVLLNDTTGETASLQIAATGSGSAYTETEVQGDDSFSRYVSPKAPYDGRYDGNVSVVMKASGGTALARELSVTIWGQIA